MRHRSDDVACRSPSRTTSTSSSTVPCTLNHSTGEATDASVTTTDVGAHRLLVSPAAYVYRLPDMLAGRTGAALAVSEAKETSAHLWQNVSSA